MDSSRKHPGGHMSRSQSLGSVAHHKLVVDLVTKSPPVPVKPKVKSKIDLLPRPRDYDEIRPFDLCNKLKSKLPLRFVVSQGVYGNSAMNTFTEGDQYTAHFVQEVGFSWFQTLEDNKLYRIPHISSVSASPLYNPMNNLSHAVNGYVFSSASQLLDSSNPLPKIVAVLKGHSDDKNPSYSVEVNDVLLVNCGVMISKKRYLKCVHISTGLKKFIREDCKVRLSTRPAQILLPIRVIVQQLQCPLQILVMFPESVSGINRHQQKCLGISKKEIIGTIEYFNSGNLVNIICSQKGKKELVAIPQSFDFDIREVISDEMEQESLNTQAVNYLKVIRHTKIKYDVLLCMDSHIDQHSHVQLLFYTFLDQECVKKSIACPEKLKRYFPMKHSDTTPLKPISDVNSRLALLEEGMQMLLAEVKLLKETLDKNEMASCKREITEDVPLNKHEEMAETSFDMVMSLQKRVADLEKKESLLSAKIKNLEQNHTSYEQEESEYQKLIKPIPPRKHSATNINKIINSPQETNHRVSGALTDSGAHTVSANNVKYLSSLSVKQIGIVLEKLNMEEYVSVFQEQGISGQTLANLNDLDLITRLNVNNSIHRYKLKQLITGVESAYPLIMLI